MLGLKSGGSSLEVPWAQLCQLEMKRIHLTPYYSSYSPTSKLLPSLHPPTQTRKWSRKLYTATLDSKVMHLMNLKIIRTQNRDARHTPWVQSWHKYHGSIQPLFWFYLRPYLQDEIHTSPHYWGQETVARQARATRARPVTISLVNR